MNVNYFLVYYDRAFLFGLANIAIMHKTHTTPKLRPKHTAIMHEAQQLRIIASF
eukprot:TRINITY_DN3902_c0_g1_i1.p2 TRINITY_DN3902_c0_g1~~TRINITY_DN3902_c0_g1_i1.p2  ORF type:complete len:54 (-),score=1.97 TRINITY_DN3902_c0_g1_i1:381-542(-)